MAAPSPTPVADPPEPAPAKGPLRQQVEAGLPEPVRVKLKALLWRDRLTSLWAPVTVFGLAFLAYLLTVELHTPAFSWAQPLLKGFGAFILLAFVGLWLARLVAKAPLERRRLRTLARELRDEVLEVGDKAAVQRDKDLLLAVVDHTAALDAAIASEDTERLQGELQRYEALMEKRLHAHRRNGTVYFASGLVKALAVALLIRTVLIEPFRIPSGSMIPTLAIGDQIFVNKFIYGVRIPFTNWVPFVIVREPARGDVVVFNNPVDESKDYIKRIIGLGGDLVEVRDEELWLNGQRQPRALVDARYLYDYRHPDDAPWESKEGTLYQEELAGNRYPILQTPGSPEGDRFGPITVPPGHVFVMGDNRENSADSRVGFGVTNRLEFVPVGNIKGKAMVIWLSLSRGGLLSGLFEGTGIRTDRFFLPVR